MVTTIATRASLWQLTLLAVMTSYDCEVIKNITTVEEAPGEPVVTRQQMSRQHLQQPSSGNVASEPKVSADEFTKTIRKKRRAIRDEQLRWTRAEIPYRIAPNVFSASEEYDILKAMTEWERYTCLKFRPASENDVNYVLIGERGGGCWAMLGMVGKEQPLSLSRYGCRFSGLYLHELGHTLGLIHEHQRPDRDGHIQVLFHNVQPSVRKYYEKLPLEEVNNFGVPYDISSVMHYEATAFATRPDYPTYKVMDKNKDESNVTVTEKNLAFSDVKIVNLMYNCSASCPMQTQCQGEGVLDQNCRCVCPDGTDSCQQSGTRTKTQPRFDPRTCSDVAKHGYCENILDDWKCFVWANEGQCQQNPVFMKNNCNKACSLCGQKNTETNACVDVYLEEKCTRWKERGECASNAEWMKRHCGKTCNFCGDPRSQPEVGCSNQDDDMKCDVMAHEGKCVLNGRWMMANCRRSCRACAGDTVYHKDACYDKHPTFQCADLARYGGCRKDKTWMIANCRKTCRMCGDNDLQPYIMINCTDAEGTEQCWDNKQESKCQEDADLMADICTKTCGKCPESFYKYECIDTYSARDCKKMAERDGCRKDSHTMKKICKKTCGYCTDCIDKFKTEDCARWAKSGECEKNPTCMIDNCRKSCNKCMEGKDQPDKEQVNKEQPNKEQPKTECIDSYDPVDCPKWANAKHCEINPSFMLKNCMKSCGKCSGSNDGKNQQDTEQVNKEQPNKEQPKTECIDSYDPVECPKWANAKHCEINPSFMLHNCMKSCGKCRESNDGKNQQDTKQINMEQPNKEQPDKEQPNKEQVNKEQPDKEQPNKEQPKTECIDSYNPEQCQEWAQTKHCETNPSFMLHYCMKSCGKCSGSNDGQNQLGNLQPDKEQPVVLCRPSPDARKEKPKSECVDKHDTKQCQDWAQNDHCKINPSWMIPNCQKSCGQCS